MKKPRLSWTHSYTYEEIKYADPYEMKSGPFGPRIKIGHLM